MNQLPSLERLRPLLRIETAVVVAILVLAVAWYIYDQKASEAQEVESAIDQKLKTVQRDLQLWDANNDPDTLVAALAELQSGEQGPVALPLRVDASRFRIELLSYADAHGLSLPAFDQVESVASLAEQEYQAIRYSIAAQGTANILVGVLMLLQDFPTAAVQTLDFVRPPEGFDDWNMNLELDIFFDDEGA